MTNIDEAAEKYADKDWPKKSDWDRADRYETRMKYEIRYEVEEAFCAGATFALNCDEVKAMREALKCWNKVQWKIDKGPEFAATELIGDRDAIQDAEYLTDEALTAFDKLLEQVDDK